eukprot:CAMPEP_0178467920 /NCGR_PEP_ID=MMETSP0689_2-20121128/52657_1 /TAXON_ID=160604 /ORGANISM="Amphidinium massartii, Strain CS-259" /LENGTH=593 /DNA_ID=CAMNT_0020094969 /DNA_START=53 /DNA_END=1830 /DNA_ORIENTATION=-
MGAGVAAQIARVVPPDSWSSNQRGPTLRRLFGGYLNADIWAVYRRFKQVDDGNGFLSYQEYQQVIDLEEFNRLFVWDIYSQQNELMDARDILVTVCLFSSARLDEKGRFLTMLFDSSASGNCTGAEIAQLCAACFRVLAKCTQVLLKAREVTSAVKAELPELVAPYREALEREGKPEVMFHECRIIGATELQWLLPSIQGAYEALPIAGPPPANAAPPPAPDWSKSAQGGSQNTRATSSSGGKQATSTGTKKRATDANTASFTWMARIEEEAGEGKENLDESNSGVLKIGPPPAQAWMVIHGKAFAAVAKDICGFRRLFGRSVAAALGIPTHCVEVVNVKSGSIIVEFYLHSSSRGGDGRDPRMLVQLLEQQLSSSYSALRKGPFKEFAQSAELTLGEPRKPTAISDMPREQNGDNPLCFDQGVQTGPSLSRTGSAIIGSRKSSLGNGRPPPLWGQDGSMWPEAFQTPSRKPASALATPMSMARSVLDMSADSQCDDLMEVGSEASGIRMLTDHVVGTMVRSGIMTMPDEEEGLDSVDQLKQALDIALAKIQEETSRADRAEAALASANEEIARKDAVIKSGPREMPNLLYFS